MDHSTVLLLTHENGKCFSFYIHDCHTKTRFVKGPEIKISGDKFRVLRANQTILDVYNNDKLWRMTFEDEDLWSSAKEIGTNPTNVMCFYSQGRLFGIQQEIKESSLVVVRWDDSEIEGKPVKVQKLTFWETSYTHEVCTSPIAFESGFLFVVRISDMKKKLHLHRLVWMDSGFKVTKFTLKFYLQKRSHEHVFSLCFHQDKLLLGCTATDREKGFLASIPLLKFTNV